MKVLFLTTQTPHHTWFAEKLAEKVGIDVIIVSQTKLPQATFETAHPFEKERDQYEKDLWFSGKEPLLKNYGDFLSVENINDTKAAAFIQRVKPDITVVFGTSIIRENLLDLLKDQVFNLHGGNPEHYRGLDSHLWAIYNKEFEHLMTALHVLSPQLDTGDLVGVKKLSIPPNTKLFQLRSINTQACWDLTSSLLEAFVNNKKIDTQKQKSKGKMYSFMPADLKEICKNQFEEWTHGKN